MKKKIIALCLIVALAATAVIGGTLAYFTDTDAKTNVFTTGNVDITLTEPEWDAAKEADPTHSKLMPGRRIVKDATITVEEGSERAYTFMKIELSDDFVALLQAYAGEDFDWDDQTAVYNLIGKWFDAPRSKVMEMGTNYVILGVLSPKDAGVATQYLNAVTVPADVPSGMIDENGTYEIDITAYAIQAEGFEPAGPFADDAAENAAKQAARQAAFDALFN